MATLATILVRLEMSPDGCWLWPGALVDGYGNTRVTGRPGTHLVHRVVYEALVGRIPASLTLDHLCRVRRCANPLHVEPVTQRENWFRGQAPSRQNVDKTTCPKGHPYDTTWSNGDGRRGRRCRECERVRGRAKYAANPDYWRQWRARRAAA